jgi:hypothetical protein
MNEAIILGNIYHRFVLFYMIILFNIYLKQIITIFIRLFHKYIKFIIISFILKINIQNYYFTIINHYFSFFSSSS